MYIFENNIYYQSDVRSNSLRLTSSGKEGVIYNGIADWLYEGETLFSSIWDIYETTLMNISFQIVIVRQSVLYVCIAHTCYCYPTVWLCTEEILHTHVAHWWSLDGERLAFLVLNDSLVPNMVLPTFTGSAYPKGKQYPYPKVSSNS